MTVTHTRPDCGLTITQRLQGRSIDQGCPDCMPEKRELDTYIDQFGETQ